ncbi:protein FAM133A-like [Scylla paramamosain]|uniref:protein FAM133A-like n=1 Tax=Scylla paramamosain TaxID=85552 RepID=UPI0030833C6E
MPEDFGTPLYATRFNNKKRKQKAMDAHEILGEKRNMEKTKETKEHNKKRRLESLGDCTSHKKTHTESCEEVKHRTKTRKGGDESHESKMDCEQEVEKHSKKRKSQDTEEHDSQAKRRKWQDTEEHDNQAKKRKWQGTEEHDNQAKRRKRQETEEHDNQTKKKKRQDTEEHENQAKKKKKSQDTEEHDNQAKRRKRQDTGDHKKQVKKSKGKGRKERKKSGKMDSDDVLRLKVDAERVNKEERDMRKYCHIHIEKGSKVDATVRGTPCVVVLDTGASISAMNLSLAQSLGLVTGREETVKKRLETWNGKLDVDVIKLGVVVVELKGGVSVNAPILVLVRGMKFKGSARHAIVLSMSLLQEAKMRQQFHLDDSSSLFLRHPERLRRR